MGMFIKLKPLKFKKHPKKGKKKFEDSPVKVTGLRRLSFRNWKMSHKINTLVLLVAVLMNAVGLISYYFYRQENNALNGTYANSLLSVKYLNQINSDLNAIEALSMELLLAPIDNFRKQLLESEISTNYKLIDNLMAKYQSLAQDPFTKSKLPILKTELANYRTEQQKALDMESTGEAKNLVYYYYSNNAMPHLDVVQILVPQMVDNGNNLAVQTIYSDNITFNRITMILAVLPLAAILLALVLGNIVAKRVSNPLVSILNRVNEIAQGNLQGELLAVNAEDEVGQLARAFNIMHDSLRKLVEKVGQSARNVAQSAEFLRRIMEENGEMSTQVAGAVREVTEGAENQAVAADETSTGIEQIYVNIQQVARNSDSVIALMGKTGNAVEAGQDAVSQASSRMAVLQVGTDTLQSTMEELSTSSQKIGEIVKAINDITERTNLLALNAAIEAARAGEQGRGFAVVAMEIRKLAQQSKEANMEIAELIGENKQKINQAVEAMAKEVDAIREGIEVVLSAGQAFEGIAVSIDEVSDEVSAINGSFQSISNGSEQIVRAMQQVDKISQNTLHGAQSVTANVTELAASLQQIALTGETLLDMARELTQSIDKFKL